MFVPTVTLWVTNIDDTTQEIADPDTNIINQAFQVSVGYKF